MCNVYCVTKPPPSVGLTFPGFVSFPSGEELQADVCRGVELLGEDCVAVCFPGPVTTPEVHFCVAYLNERHLPLDQASLQEAQQAFRSSLIEGYKSLCGPAGGQVNSTIDTLVVDASHGVGAMLMQDLVQELSPYIRVELCNTGGGRQPLPE